MKSMSIKDYQGAVVKLQKQAQIAIRYMKTARQQGEAFGMIFALKGFITDSEYEELFRQYKESYEENDEQEGGEGTTK